MLGLDKADICIFKTIIVILQSARQNPADTGSLSLLQQKGHCIPAIGAARGSQVDISRITVLDAGNKLGVCTNFHGTEGADMDCLVGVVSVSLIIDRHIHPGKSTTVRGCKAHDGSKKQEPCYVQNDFFASNMPHTSKTPAMLIL